MVRYAMSSTDPGCASSTDCSKRKEYKSNRVLHKGTVQRRRVTTAVRDNGCKRWTRACTTHTVDSALSHKYKSNAHRDSPPSDVPSLSSKRLGQLESNSDPSGDLRAIQTDFKNVLSRHHPRLARILAADKSKWKEMRKTEKYKLANKFVADALSLIHI